MAQLPVNLRRSLMTPTEGQQKILGAAGHLLVVGGPGSGKTTVSIVKAAKVVREELQPYQKVLFLSFARATVSRVLQAIERDEHITPSEKGRIEVETYHSFFWRLLKTHGYLIGLPRPIEVLTPPAEAIALSKIRIQFSSRQLSDKQTEQKKLAENMERTRLAFNEGRVCFDYFALYVKELLEGSQRLRRLVATSFPVIVLDEFQDTNELQWLVVQALGANCRLIALADPQQRIYDWIGADPARLDQFRARFQPLHVDLGAENHRSRGTDIALFGDDIVRGEFRQKEYKGVVIETFKSYRADAFTKLIATIYGARKRLASSGSKDWTIAILVPTKKLTRIVSDALRNPPGKFKRVQHSALIELEAAVLSAEVIACLLQPGSPETHLDQFIDLMAKYFEGRGGDAPSKGALEEAARIRNAYKSLRARSADSKGISKNRLLAGMLDVYQRVRALVFTGNPDADWRSIRSILEQGECSRLRQVAEDACNIRVLERGADFRQTLFDDWRANGGYVNALRFTQQAFLRDHFSTNREPDAGVLVMNMHKAKGKQFDEVIIFESWPIKRKGQTSYNGDRIVWWNTAVDGNVQARQNFRVSVTRAKQRTTILTPKSDPCVLLDRKLVMS